MRYVFLLLLCLCTEIRGIVVSDLLNIYHKSIMYYPTGKQVILLLPSILGRLTTKPDTENKQWLV